METLAWERLSEYIANNAPALVSMGGNHGVQIGFEPRESRLFVRVPTSKNAFLPTSPYVELTVEERLSGPSTFLEFCVKSSHLFREFHRLAGLFTEELETTEVSPESALSIVLERWRELTLMRRFLSYEEQIGLFGELFVLRGLVEKLGATAVASWTAKSQDNSERHDFRVGSVDLEVKTTKKPRRQHIIHGLGQLEASEGHRLYLISIRVEAAGLNNGLSLVDSVTTLRSMFREDQRAQDEFTRKLSAYGYYEEDAKQYGECLLFADVPLVLEVDSACPRLTQQSISRVLGSELAGRIGNDIVYTIDIEGLGRPYEVAVLEDLGTSSNA